MSFPELTPVDELRLCFYAMLFLTGMRAGLYLATFLFGIWKAPDLPCGDEEGDQ